jgi:hypothetical protein
MSKYNRTANRQLKILEKIDKIERERIQEIMSRLRQITVMPIRKAQAIGEQNYQKYLEEYRRGERQAFPHIAMSKWFTARGYERKTGFVARLGNTQVWRKTKKQAIKDLMDDIRRYT